MKNSKYFKKQEQVFKESLEEISNKNAKLLSEEEISRIIESRMQQVDRTISSYEDSKNRLKSLGEYRIHIVKGAVIPLLIAGTISLATYGGYAIFHDKDNPKNEKYYSTVYNVTRTTIDNDTFEKHDYEILDINTDDYIKKYGWDRLIIYDSIPDSDLANVYYTKIGRDSAEQYLERLETKDENIVVDVKNLMNNKTTMEEKVINPRHSNKQYIALEMNDVEEKIDYSDAKKEGYTKPTKNKFRNASLGILSAGGICGLVDSLLVSSDYYGERKEYKDAKEEYKKKKRKMKSLMK